MGIWSTLAKIAGIGAAPFTGGASLAVLPAVSAIGSALGSVGAGRAAGRVDEANLAALQNRGLMDQHRAELDARAAALTRPGARASNSVRGDILANAQDARIDTPSTIPRFTVNGGLRPSMFSDATRQLGREMSAQALAGQQANDDLLAPPRLIAAPQAGTLDSILNVAGTVGGLAGLMGTLPYKRRRPVSLTDIPSDNSGWG